MEDNKSRKRQRRQIVSEEEYTSSLESIIQRDYFGEVPDLQLKLAVLNRRSQNDHDGVVRVRRAASRLKHQEIALEEQEEADERAVDEHGFRENPRPLLKEDLTNFHNRITSEDNVDFERNQEKDAKTHKKKLQLLYQVPAQRQHLLLKENGEENYVDTEYLALASDEFHPPSASQDKASSDAKKSQLHNTLFFFPLAVPAPVAATTGDSNESSATGPPKYDPPNDEYDRALMPPPLSQFKRNNDTNSVVMKRASNGDNSAKQGLVEYVPKTNLKKRIVPAKTRFPMSQAIAACLQEHRAKTTTLALERTANSEAMSYKDSDTEYSSDTDASTDIESMGGDLHKERRAYARHKKRELQTFVNMSPLPTPGVDIGESTAFQSTSEGNERPIDTWGGSLVRSGAAAASEEGDLARNLGASIFAVSDENERDKAAKTALLVLEKRKAKASSSKSTGSRSGSSNRSGSSMKPRHSASRPRPKGSANTRDISSFSPAAMSLLAKTSKQQNPTARSGSSFASALRSSYTPQRASRSDRSTSARNDHSYRSTPRIALGTRERGTKLVEENAKMTRKAAVMSKSENITDGLLRLN